jgi:hypothetical protein
MLRVIPPVAVRAWGSGARGEICRAIAAQRAAPEARGRSAHAPPLLPAGDLCRRSPIRAGSPAARVHLSPQQATLGRLEHGELGPPRQPFGDRLGRRARRCHLPGRRVMADCVAEAMLTMLTQISLRCGRPGRCRGTTDHLGQPRPPCLARHLPQRPQGAIRQSPGGGATQYPP